MVEGSERRLLNRVIRCIQQGWEGEPDQRPLDLIVQEPDLKGAPSASVALYHVALPVMLDLVRATWTSILFWHT